MSGKPGSSTNSRYASSTTAIVRPSSRRRKSSSCSCVHHVPVGLFGLQTTTSFVRPSTRASRPCVVERVVAQRHQADVDAGGASDPFRDGERLVRRDEIVALGAERLDDRADDFVGAVPRQHHAVVDAAGTPRPRGARSRRRRSDRGSPAPPRRRPAPRGRRRAVRAGSRCCAAGSNRARRSGRASTASGGAT